MMYDDDFNEYEANEPDDLETLNANEADDYRNEGEDEDDSFSPSMLAFANPGGNSALRASSPSNPRNLPCPTCGEANRLTPADRTRGYQCDACADRAEGGGGY